MFSFSWFWLLQSIQEDSYGENNKARIAYHRPWEPCKSQFAVQTPPNNCREKQVCNMVSVQWLIVPQERQICKNESSLSWWALSNAIAAEYEMKFHFRWHQIERSGEKKVASPTLPLTISSVESNQGGMRLKFLVCFVPPPRILASYHDKCCGWGGASSGSSISSIYFHVKTTELTGTFTVRREAWGR